MRGQSQTGPIEPPFREDEQNGIRAGKSVLDVHVHNGTAYTALSVGNGFYVALAIGAGLAVGATLASMPGIASADPAPDPNIFSSIDISPLLQDALPAADPTANIAISIDGFTLLQDGTATATSSMGNIAIASGADTDATATGGFLNPAVANGLFSTATAGTGDANTAFAADGNFDSATANSNNAVAEAIEGNSNHAFSGVGGGTALAEFGNGNDASVLGTSAAQAGGTSADLLGNNDIATILGYGSEATAGANLADRAVSTLPASSVTASMRTRPAPTSWSIFYRHCSDRAAKKTPANKAIVESEAESRPCGRGFSVWLGSRAMCEHERIPSAAMVNQIVVAGAIVAESMVLIAQRTRPPELAGRWELPGGKVAAGESEAAALARELAEELGVVVAVGPRLGDDVALNPTMTLRAYAAALVRGEPRPHDHSALRWVSAAELQDVDWVPADRGFVAALGRLLSF